MLLCIVLVPDKSLHHIVMLKSAPKFALILHLVVQFTDAQVGRTVIQVARLRIIHCLI